MRYVIPRSGSRKVNGYVKAALALEAVRKKREDQNERVVRPARSQARRAGGRGRDAPAGAERRAARRGPAAARDDHAGDGERRPRESGTGRACRSSPSASSGSFCCEEASRDGRGVGKRTAPSCAPQSAPAGPVTALRARPTASRSAAVGDLVADRRDYHYHMRLRSPTAVHPRRRRKEGVSGDRSTGTAFS